MEIQLERFDKTRLERELDVIYGSETNLRLVYNDIEKTYMKYLYEKGTTDITIITNLVNEQVYKFSMFEVKIKNNFN
jgi:hypothetical protein